MTRVLLTTMIAGITFAQQPATFSSSTQLVVERVSVKDKSGKTIAGLTAKDFVLTEDGKPQTLAFVEFQTLPDSPAAPIAFTESVAPLSRLTRTQIAPEKPRDIHYRDRRLLALYFDFSSMQQSEQLRSLKAAQSFVRTKMTGSDLMAIMTYSSGAVEVMMDFTADRGKLLEALQTLLVGEEPETAANPGDGTASDTGAAFGQNDGEFNLFNTDRQLSALQTAINMLGRLNEKKSLMYFASGLRLNGSSNQAQLYATVNAAVRAGVSLWPVDARGLVAEPPLGDATRGSTGGVAMYSGAAAQGVAGNFQRSQDTLYALAADTGGKALLDNNDLSKGIEQAQKAISSYYLIGYYTSNAALDGKLRRIKITLADGLAADIDYRQSYYAGKEFSKFNAADKERQLEDALMLADPITELTIALELNYFQLNRAEYFVPVALKIPGSELARAKKGGAERTLIDFMGEIKEGRITVANLRDKIELKLSGQTAAELATRPITYDTGFTLLPGTYTLKILARDAETGRIGTYLRTFTIPNLNKEDKRVATSSIVLSSQTVDMRDALFSVRDKLKAQEVNPLVRDGQKMIPSVTRVFRRNKEMRVFLQAYQQEVETAQPTLGYVSFFRNGAKVFESTPVVATQASGTRLKILPIEMRVGLEGLVPGEYDCQVTVINPDGKKASFWQTPIMVIP